MSLIRAITWCITSGPALPRTWPLWPSFRRCSSRPRAHCTSRFLTIVASRRTSIGSLQHRACSTCIHAPHRRTFIRVWIRVPQARHFRDLRNPSAPGRGPVSASPLQKVAMPAKQLARGNVTALLLRPLASKHLYRRWRPSAMYRLGLAAAGMQTATRHSTCPQSCCRPTAHRCAPHNHCRLAWPASRRRGLVRRPFKIVIPYGCEAAGSSTDAAPSNACADTTGTYRSCQ